MKKLLYFFSLIILALGLVSCGGAGGSSTPPVTYSIAGTTTAGATVDLTGTSTASTLADVNGSYSFNTLAAGNYTVTPSLSGYTFSPASKAVSIGNAAVTGVDFSATLTNPPTYSISGNVSGSVQAGVTITLTPGNSSTVTDSGGNYLFAGVTNGAYTVTPSVAGNPTFTPANASVTVNGANVNSVNFTTPIPVLATGKLLYPCPMAICKKDLSTGVESVVWGAYNVYPDTIVPYRTGSNVAYVGGNVGGIVGMSLSTLSNVGSISGMGMLATNCTSYPQGIFDISPLGDFVAIASYCTPIGLAARSDIFLVKTDGSLFWSRVTSDADIDYAPVIGGVDAVTGNVTVLYISEKSGVLGIWKQVVDPVADMLVGTQVLLANNIIDGAGSYTYPYNLIHGDRAMSVNSSYTQLAFMKRVGGMSHIIVMPLAGGAEIDLGIGTNPYWTLDGSNKILYTANNALWVINPDGSGKASVPTPSNLSIGSYYGLGKVVFGPAGF